MFNQQPMSKDDRKKLIAHHTDLGETKKSKKNIRIRLCDTITLQDVYYIAECGECRSLTQLDRCRFIRWGDRRDIRKCNHIELKSTISCVFFTIRCAEYPDDMLVRWEEPMYSGWFTRDKLVSDIIGRLSDTICTIRVTPISIIQTAPPTTWIILLSPTQRDELTTAIHKYSF